jgi:CRP/FNR family transcriptional regulator, anaerobic regulatory protein
MEHAAMTAKSGVRLDIPAIRAACSACSLRELCLPVGLKNEDMALLDAVIDRRRQLKAGQHVYRWRDSFEALYAIRSGLFKTYDLSNDGQEQVNGFHMTGEILGLDAIGTDRHMCSAVALEDCEVCIIPFARLEELLHDMPSLMRQFHRLMSREISADHHMMTVLGNMSAEQKLAAFLTNLSERLDARGLSPTVLHLSMSREEIGNYLGLKLETVSRMFSKFQDDGLLRVERRNLTIADLPALQQLAGGAGAARKK